MNLSRIQRAMLLAVPGLVYALFLFLPLISLVRMSFREFRRSTGIRDVFTLDTYASILTEPLYLRVWLRTLELALTTAVLTTLLGSLVALIMWRVGGRFRAYFTILVLAPLFISGVARSYGWIAFAGPSGLLPIITETLGMGNNTIIFSNSGVIVGFVNVLMPFVVLTVITRLDSIPSSLLRASASLGSSTLQTLRNVVFPIAAPSVMASFFVAFALASTSYAVPAVLGGGRVYVIATQIVHEQVFRFDLPKAAALSVLLTGLTLILMSIAQMIRSGKFAKLLRRKGSASQINPSLDSLSARAT